MALRKIRDIHAYFRGGPDSSLSPRRTYEDRSLEPCQHPEEHAAQKKIALILKRVSEKAALGEHAQAIEEAGDLLKQAPEGHEGIQRLERLLKATLRLDFTQHQRGLDDATRPGQAALDVLKSPRSPRDSGIGQAAFARQTPSGDTPIGLEQQVKNFLRELQEESENVKTEFTDLLESAILAMEAFVDVLTEIRPALVFEADASHFLAPRAVAERMRETRKRLKDAKQCNQEQVFSQLRDRMDEEVSLIEALLVTDLRASSLRGAQAVAALVRSEKLLDNYMSIRNLQLSVCIESGDACAGVSESVFSPALRPAAAPGFAVEPMSPSMSPMSPFRLNFDGSGSVKPRDLPSREITRLESFYLELYNHCHKKVHVLFDSGFSAVFRSWPFQAAKAVETMEYGLELKALVAEEMVVIVGIFANAGQFPHLQVARRSAESSGTAWTSLTACFDDPSWLLPALCPSDVACSGGDDFLCLSFASSGEAGPVEKLAALEAWRHRPELRYLLALLAKACTERVANAKDFDAAPMQMCRQQSCGRSSPARKLSFGQGRSIDRPDNPFESVVAENGQPVRCLVYPLDVGWFQAPLFLGLVLHERARDSASTDQTRSEDGRRGRFGFRSRMRATGSWMRERFGRCNPREEAIVGNSIASNIASNPSTVFPEDGVDHAERARKALMSLADKISGRSQRKYWERFAAAESDALSPTIRRRPGDTSTELGAV